MQAEKAKRLPSHPLHLKLDNRTKNRLKRQSLNHIVKDLQKLKAPDPNIETELLAPDPWVPRQCAPEIKLEVPGVEEKGKQHQALQKSLTLEMINDRYPTHS